MAELSFHQGSYHSDDRSPHWFAQHFPSMCIYLQMLQCILQGSRKAQQHKFDATELTHFSLQMLRAMEAAGLSFTVEGATHFQALQEPCVFVANHMSTLETLVLPSLIQPNHQVTYILKKDLLQYPLVKDLLLATKAIAVTQTDAKADLHAIMEGSSALFSQGISVIVFPEGRRNEVFRKDAFNTLGIKIAKRHQVPIVPIALKTDAWPMGKYISDFSRIHPHRHVHIEFSEPLRVQGNGREQHQSILTFMENRLRHWGAAIEL